VLPPVEPHVAERQPGNWDGVDQGGEHSADVVGVDVGDHQQFEVTLIGG